MVKNQLKLNADKTHVMTLGTARRLQVPGNEVTVLMDNITLEEDPKKCEKLLGCVIQANLKWQEQIRVLKSKLKQRLAGLGHIKYVLPLNTRRAVCVGMFNSVLVSCVPLFGGCDVQDVKDLQVFQNKAARIVSHSPLRERRERMYDNLGWLTVKQLILYHTLLTVYRTRNSQEPEYLASILSRDNPYGKIIITNTNLSLYRKSFAYRGVINWNLLPTHVRQISAIGAFKKELKNWIKREVPRFLD